MGKNDLPIIYSEIYKRAKEKSFDGKIEVDTLRKIILFYRIPLQSLRKIMQEFADQGIVEFNNGSKFCLVK